MGTERYPNEQEYSLAINNYGGSQNAFTTLEHTNVRLTHAEHGRAKSCASGAHRDAADGSLFCVDAWLSHLLDSTFST